MTATLEVIHARFQETHSKKFKYNYDSIRRLTNLPTEIRTAPTYRLNLSGTEIPCIGLGAFSKKTDSPNVVQSVKTAIDVGYRHFDCACHKDDEKDIGQGIREKISAGVIKRHEVFVVAKLCNIYQTPELVERGCTQSLKNLGLDYVDLFLLQKDECDKQIPDICNLWKGMEQLVYKGLAKAVGVSHFKPEELTKILNICRIPPAVNQIELDPYSCKRKLVEFCQIYGIRVVCSSSPVQNSEKKAAPLNEPSLLHDPILLEIAQKYNRTVTQIISRWLIQRGVIAINPKSLNFSRLEHNLNLFNFHLSHEDMDMIFSLNRTTDITLCHSTLR